MIYELSPPYFRKSLLESSDGLLSWQDELCLRCRSSVSVLGGSRLHMQLLILDEASQTAVVLFDGMTELLSSVLTADGSSRTAVTLDGAASTKARGTTCKIEFCVKAASASDGEDTSHPKLQSLVPFNSSVSCPQRRSAITTYTDDSPHSPTYTGGEEVGQLFSLHSVHISKPRGPSGRRGSSALKPIAIDQLHPLIIRTDPESLLSYSQENCSSGSSNGALTPSTPFDKLSLPSRVWQDGSSGAAHHASRHCGHASGAVALTVAETARQQLGSLVRDADAVGSMSISRPMTTLLSPPIRQSTLKHSTWSRQHKGSRSALLRGTVSESGSEHGGTDSDAGSLNLRDEAEIFNTISRLTLSLKSSPAIASCQTPIPLRQRILTRNQLSAAPEVALTETMKTPGAERDKSVAAPPEKRRPFQMATSQLAPLQLVEPELSSSTRATPPTMAEAPVEVQLVRFGRARFSRHASMHLEATEALRMNRGETHVTPADTSPHVTPADTSPSVQAHTIVGTETLPPSSGQLSSRRKLIGPETDEYCYFPLELMHDDYAMRMLALLGNAVRANSERILGKAAAARLDTVGIDGDLLAAAAPERRNESPVAADSEPIAAPVDISEEVKLLKFVSSCESVHEALKDALQPLLELFCCRVGSPSKKLKASGYLGDLTEHFHWARVVVATIMDMEGDGADPLATRGNANSVASLSLFALKELQEQMDSHRLSKEQRMKEMNWTWTTHSNEEGGGDNNRYSEGWSSTSSAIGEVNIGIAVVGAERDAVVAAMTPPLHKKDGNDAVSQTKDGNDAVSQTKKPLSRENASAMTKWIVERSKGDKANLLLGLIPRNLAVIELMLCFTAIKDLLSQYKDFHKGMGHRAETLYLRTFVDALEQQLTVDLSSIGAFKTSDRSLSSDADVSSSHPTLDTSCSTVDFSPFSPLPKSRIASADYMSTALSQIFHDLDSSMSSAVASVVPPPESHGATGDRGSNESSGGQAVLQSGTSRASKPAIATKKDIVAKRKSWSDLTYGTDVGGVKSSSDGSGEGGPPPGVMMHASVRNGKYLLKRMHELVRSCEDTVQQLHEHCAMVVQLRSSIVRADLEREAANDELDESLSQEQLLHGIIKELNDLKTQLHRRLTPLHLSDLESLSDLLKGTDFQTVLPLRLLSDPLTTNNSIASLLIRSKSVALVASIYTNWPNLIISCPSDSAHHASGDSTLQQRPATDIDVADSLDFDDVGSLRRVGFSLRQLRDSQCYELQQLLVAGYPLMDIRTLKAERTGLGLGSSQNSYCISAKDLRCAGYSIQQVLTSCSCDET